jgi:ABC-type branched-subunit amino acid transport system substrate-binding protein
MVRVRRVLLGLIIACGTIGAATATAGNAVTAHAAGSSVSCSTSATIGYMGPTTGPVASIGEELRDWPLFYISQWNATHKFQIHVVEGDDQFDPSQASTIAQQFGSNPDMLGVLGPGSSPEVEAAAPLFKKAGMSYIAATATNATLTNGTFGHFFRIAPPDSVQAQTTATYMTKVLKVKSVAIFDDQSAYSKPLADSVESLLKKAGVSVFRSSVSPTATDYSATITTIPSGTQLVYTPFTNPASMQLFGEQMVDQGKNIPMFAGDSGYSSKFHIVGARFSTFAPDIRDLPADKATIAAYFKKEGSNAPLTTYGPPSYVAAQMMVAAVAMACANGTATRVEVNADLHKVSLKTSLLGHPIKFTANGEDAGARFVIFQIGKDGKPVVVQK